MSTLKATATKARRTRPTSRLVETGDPAKPISFAPISFAEGKARVKRRRLTTPEFRDAVAQARATTGYGEGSPIFGQKTEEVIDRVSTILNDKAFPEDIRIVLALELIDPLRARFLTNKLVSKARQGE